MAFSRNLHASEWGSLLVCLVFCATIVDAARVRVDLRSLLGDPANGWSVNTTISFPGSAEFEEATERWTIYRPPTYRAAICPGTEDDIIKIVSGPGLRAIS